jgi:hypothetical protein
MNHGLFTDARQIRERGGIPVPAHLMPLRYAYEGMIVEQAVSNPFEVERLRLQHRIDKMRKHSESLAPRDTESFELAKEGLRRLLASGAVSKDVAAELVTRIRRIASTGKRIEVETMKVWPDDAKNARPASEFFVNDRIDLLIREAESFRNDYRDKEYRIIFHALKKPMPWAGMKKSTANGDVDDSHEIDTRLFCALILFSIIALCGVISTLVISRQNRSTS